MNLIELKSLSEDQRLDNWAERLKKLSSYTSESMEAQNPSLARIIWEMKAFAEHTVDDWIKKLNKQ